MLDGIGLSVLVLSGVCSLSILSVTAGLGEINVPAIKWMFEFS